MNPTVLFTTVVTFQEVLSWENFASGSLQTALTDEAYGRWLEHDRETAEYWAVSWESRVSVADEGYYVELYANTNEGLSTFVVPNTTVEALLDAVRRLRGIQVMYGCSTLRQRIALLHEENELRAFLCEVLETMLVKAALIKELPEPLA